MPELRSSHQVVTDLSPFFPISANARLTLFLSFHRRKSEAAPIRNYFIRRFFRIAPFYYLVFGFWRSLITTGLLSYLTWRVVDLLHVVCQSVTASPRLSCVVS
jgi:hypothetical protein